MTARSVRRTLRLVVLAVAVVAPGCVGSGKTARTDELGPLPAGMSVVYDTTMGCRSGESGFDYRFVVVGPTDDLSSDGPLLSALRRHGFYHSQGWSYDLPWISVAYQHQDYPLRAELAPLSAYLDDPVPFEGPDPAALPAAVREHPEDHVLVALRPTDFLCETPL